MADSLMQSRTIQYFSLILGFFALSTSVVLVKLANAPSSITVTGMRTITAFYQLFFATLMLLPLLLYKKKIGKCYSRSLRSVGIRAIIRVISSNILCFMVWISELQSVANSTVIATLQPLFSFVGAHFLFKEHFSKWAVANCFVALIGFFIIGWENFEVSYQALFGDVLPS